MKQSERIEIANVFRDAKSRLAKNAAECRPSNLTYEEYICWAIALLQGNHLPHAKSAAKKVISDRLGEDYSLETWVISNIPGMYFPVDKNELQAYRHRWLDALIEEFSR